MKCGRQCLGLVIRPGYDFLVIILNTSIYHFLDKRLPASILEILYSIIRSFNISSTRYRHGVTIIACTKSTPQCRDANLHGGVP